MEIFAPEPELLGNTQTLIGVLLTFIVLCLFSNDSNFLLKLIRNMVADFTNNLKQRVDDIKGEINKVKDESDKAMGTVANNRTYWISAAKEISHELAQKLLENNAKELEIRNRILQDSNKGIEDFKKSDNILSLKKEHLFASIFFLILLLTVMTLDACCISKEIGSVFLLTGCVVSTHFSSCLWYRYLVDKDDKEHLYKEHKGIIWKVAIGAIAIIVVWLCVMGIIKMVEWLLFLVAILVFVMCVYVLSQWLMHDFRYTVRYNNQFVIKHAIYVVSFCIVVAVAVCIVAYCDPPASEGMWQSFFMNLQSNIQRLTKQIVWVRVLFIFTASANTFFIPLCLGYYYNHRNAMKVEDLMDKSKEIIIKDLKENHKQYLALVKTVQDSNSSTDRK